MKSIQTETYAIHFNSQCYIALNNYLKSQNISKLFVIVDTNTHEFCLPYFISQIETNIPIEIVEIEDGESHKNIETCVGVWNVLSELGADRKSVIINLGGGVVTDLGGFVACTFKRGLKYINVPTSLLSMVDASVGGKTGVDLGPLKNQIGVINSGDMVLIDTNFLKTLPQNQLKSGLAEMLKHGLIFEREYWNNFTNLKKLQLEDLDDLIYKSVEIKYALVTKDPLENGIRKHLNYGHTIGHAIESYFLSQPNLPDLLHGEAIAIGMIMETYISNQLLGFPEKDLIEITKTINHIYKPVNILSNSYNEIIELLKYDKKNEHGNINFVLLNSIGNPKIDCSVPNDLIIEAFEYYKKEN